MTSDRRQAEKSIRNAEQELIDAKAFAERSGRPNARQEARRMARAAKRRRAKAKRRASRAQCREWE